MSDISISFSWWVLAWFAGEATPLTTIVVAIFVAALLLARRAGSSGLLRWLQAGLVAVRIYKRQRAAPLSWREQRVFQNDVFFPESRAIERIEAQQLDIDPISIYLILVISKLF